MEFPNFFPINCPPADAMAKEIAVYRICKTKAISRADFLSFYEEGKTAKGVKSYGVSVFSNQLEARTLLKMPNHKNEHLAFGVTKEECGVVKLTPSNNYSSHITWWLYKDATPEKYFKIIEEQNHE